MKVVLASGQIPGRGGRLMRALLNGVVLGLLSDTDLQALDELYYERDGMYRTVGWNDSGLTAWERREIDEWFRGRSPVVVVACGGGREVLALLNDGIDAIGYEPHPALQRFADRLLASRGFPGRALPAPRDRFSHRGPCEGVLVGWGAYSLVAPRRRRIRLLQDAAAALSTGLPVMLSVFVRPGHDRELRLTAALARVVRRLRRAPPVEIGDTLAPNRVHVFTAQELDAEMRESGLALQTLRAVAQAGSSTGYACAIGTVA